MLDLVLELLGRVKPEQCRINTRVSPQSYQLKGNVLIVKQASTWIALLQAFKTS
ncbi:hypothetical protein R6242_14050 [Iodobacter sp. CM08]|uniref:hypothetical protein n=1 Tax=Iodobacter sp. CM08 TaxID=3085902 RepID=UPI002981690B|nr:hypothetical protein [Iodobacter sp. CM08]MDW5417689.1 hypothetical protein [Iodobacter sp. CM08]